MEVSMKRKAEPQEKLKTVNGVKMKLCSTCREYKPVTEYSGRKASADGLAYSCKACERATAQKSYKKKQSSKKAQVRYQENKEEYKERAKARYQADPTAALAYQAQWRTTEKGKHLTRQATARRATRIKMQTPGGRDYTRADVVKKDTVDGQCICGICGKPIEDLITDMQIDHIVTISQGGADKLSNVRCTHKICNLMRPKDASDL